MGEDSIFLVSASCATSHGRTRDGAGGMAKDSIFLKRSVMYTMNPCVGEGQKYVSIIRSAAEDV